jgi:hypothetical protein
MKHIKTIFPSGWYHFCLTQYREDPENGMTHWTFTCDVGDRAYQHIIMDWYPQLHRHTMERMFASLGLTPLGEMDQLMFGFQFIGMRCEAKVDVVTKETYMKNVLVDWRPSVIDPDYNVLKPKTEDYFYQKKNPKKLPL